MTKAIRLSTLCLTATVLIGGPVIAAQRQLGAIQGAITDQTGAVLPAVTVKVTNTATGEVRTSVTNDRGIYRVLSLDSGRYSVRATFDGFGAVEQADVVLSVGAIFGLDFTMAPGRIIEEVRVTGALPDIQTEKADRFLRSLSASGLRTCRMPAGIRCSSPRCSRESSDCLAVPMSSLRNRR